jgi:hypothetical protein
MSPTIFMASEPDQNSPTTAKPATPAIAPIGINATQVALTAPINACDAEDTHTHKHTHTQKQIIVMLFT